MTTYLLDVNVLIALLDPAHVNHDDAHRWFAEARGLTRNAAKHVQVHPQQ